MPHKILHEVAQPVTSFDDELNKKIKRMIEVLRADENGIGLSANQLGFNNRLCVVEFNDPEKKENSIPLQTFVNPLIAEIAPEFETLEEGCLSVPKIELPVERSTKIKVKAQNQQGTKIRLTAKGLLARVLQHEIDHLNGILFTDRVKLDLYKKFPKLKKLKIVFIGTGDFAHLILEGLILLDFNLKQIITEKGKPADRTQEIKPTPVGQMAERFGKEYLEIDNLKASIGERQPDLIICADFGKIIPEDILKIPKIAAINIHPSFLPKYRGPSPIQTAILKGEKETGVSIIKMTKEIDKGPILAQENLEIFDFDNYLSLKYRLVNLALKILLDLLPKLPQGKIQSNEQDESQATYTRKFTKSDGEIDWQKSSAEINRQIRALYPWPGTYTRLPAPKPARLPSSARRPGRSDGGQAFIDNKRLIIHHAHLEDDKLVLDIVQPEGKKPMKFADFLRGFHGQKPGWFKKIKLD